MAGAISQQEGVLASSDPPAAAFVGAARGEALGKPKVPRGNGGARKKTKGESLGAGEGTAWLLRRVAMPTLGGDEGALTVFAGFLAIPSD